ncbi:uncharacterized protein LOC133172986 [Saccostrea echinata]|uniref:uncharacterized protein LOC133172986 n=1 Tax=Saccostrea echinata TaxID=191078 RepID=UPI002A8138B0|nr:uncharacterized protein LOC133172986 [Saccostrea echinata]
MMNPSIFQYMPETVRFAILRLGSNCNCKDSFIFSDARCDINSVTDERRVMLVKNFNNIFRRGIEFINEVKDGNQSFESLDRQHKAALSVLNSFVNEKELHEKSLSSILDQLQNGEVSDVEMTVALGEHLLGRLAPGQSCVINSKVNGKERCSCQLDHCMKIAKFGNTGIGHEAVWHGFVDIMFPSFESVEPECIATITNPVAIESRPTMKKTRVNSEEDGSQGTGVHITSTQSVVDKSVAETIVFSLIQKNHRPSLRNHLIPHIIISSSDFRILMYDAVNDVFLCSVLLPLFQDKCLHITSVIIIWMVLHYRLFCSGIDIEPRKLEQVHSNFRNLSREKWEVYSGSLKSCVGRFPIVSQEFFPSNDLMLLGTENF